MGTRSKVGLRLVQRDLLGQLSVRNHTLRNISKSIASNR